MSINLASFFGGTEAKYLNILPLRPTQPVKCMKGLGAWRWYSVYTIHSIHTVYCTVKAIECGQDIHYSGLVSVYNYIHNYINNLSIFLDQTNNLLD